MHLAEFQAYPELAADFQVELRQSSRFMREYKKVELKQYLDLIGEIFEQGQREDVFRRDVPAGLVKRLIFGTLDEVVSTWVLAGRHYDLESLAEPLVDLFLHGIQQNGSLSREGRAEENSTGR
jgi:TetR/AcrR family fatty acid metabolism transcriptional regulator